MEEAYYMKIYEKTISNMYVATEKHSVDIVSDELIEQLSKGFNEHFSNTDAVKTKPEEFFTVFNAEEYRDSDYDVELWYRVRSLKKDTEHIKFKLVQKSEIAYVIVLQKRDNKKFVCDELFKYIKDKGYKLNGFLREVYVPDESSENGYYTEVQIPFLRK